MAGPPREQRVPSLLDCRNYAVSHPSASSTRRVDAGNLVSFSRGRMGLATNSPPQLGQRPPSTSCLQSLQKVHSKLHITASADSGGRSLLQHSQFGRSSNTLLSSTRSQFHYHDPQQGSTIVLSVDRGHAAPLPALFAGLGDLSIA